MECDPITELQRCMALIRPAGMSDGAVRDWLTAAVAEVRHLPPRTLAAACAEARKTVSHHGQIVPAILNSQAVKDAKAHERLVAGLLRDGHQIPGRNQPQIEDRGGVKRIGQLRAIEGGKDA